MKKLTFLTVLSVLLLTTSCLNFGSSKPEELSVETDFQNVEVGQQYQLSVPKYMKETTVLNEEASLQYMNLFKETYVVVIDEPKEEFIEIFQDLEEYDNSLSVAENYRDIQLRFLEEGVDIQKMGASVSLNINGLDAEMVEIEEAMVEGVEYKVAYILTFIEGADNVYMLMTWTLHDRLEKYRKTYQSLAGSFREF